MRSRPAPTDYLSQSQMMPSNLDNSQAFLKKAVSPRATQVTRNMSPLFSAAQNRSQKFVLRREGLDEDAVYGTVER